MRELKRQKEERKLSDEEFKTQASEIKKDKSSPVVMIKATDGANYKNLIDALDEMQICNISKYAIVDITPGDKWLIENLETSGKLTQQIADPAQQAVKQ